MADAVTARAIECGTPGVCGAPGEASDPAGVARRTMGGTPRAGVATAAEAEALRGVSKPWDKPLGRVGVRGRATGAAPWVEVISVGDCPQGASDAFVPVVESAADGAGVSGLVRSMSSLGDRNSEASLGQA